MNNAQQVPCNCNACPVSGCTCGCQSTAAPAACACGPQCACGTQCRCGAQCQCGTGASGARS